MPKSNLTERLLKKISSLKLIDRTERKNSVVQIIGFILIATGVLYLLGKIIHPFGYGIAPFEGDRIAIIFFIIMLGVSFAFPDLLQDQTGGLSTMRIAVFMMVNVICILMLKIGWGKNSFADIGIDSYWVGIIAFVFGSKATQSYFESKMAVPPVPQVPSTPATPQTAPIPQDQLARLAIDQNGASLKAKFPNIESISDAVNDLSGSITHVVAIYVNDNNIIGIPTQLPVLVNGNNLTIPTEIIKNVGTGTIHNAGQNIITDTNDRSYQGSVCCKIISSDSGFTGFVTAGHMYSDGNYFDCNSVISDADTREVYWDDQVVGTWYFQTMNNTQDLAVVKIASGLNPVFKSFAQGYYTVSDNDVKTDTGCVSMISKRGEFPAYIIDYNVPFNITYNSGIIRLVQNIILIGSSRNRDNSSTISQDGDSGACVYHKNTGRLIGILMGGNDKFSFVLPIQSTLDSLDLKPM